MCGRGEVQGGEEAGDFRLQEPNPLAKDGRPVLFRLEGRLGHSQLFLYGYDSPVRQLLLETCRGEGGDSRSLLLLLGPWAAGQQEGEGAGREGQGGQQQGGLPELGPGGEAGDWLGQSLLAGEGGHCWERVGREAGWGVFLGLVGVSGGSEGSPHHCRYPQVEQQAACRRRRQGSLWRRCPGRGPSSWY